MFHLYLLLNQITKGIITIMVIKPFVIYIYIYIYYTVLCLREIVVLETEMSTDMDWMIQFLSLIILCVSVTLFLCIPLSKLKRSRERSFTLFVWSIRWWGKRVLLFSMVMGSFTCNFLLIQDLDFDFHEWKVSMMFWATVRLRIDNIDFFILKNWNYCMYPQAIFKC